TQVTSIWVDRGLIALTALDLIIVGWGFNPAVDSAAVTNEPPVLIAASEIASNGRVTVLQQDSLPDSHMLYGIEDVRGLDFKTDWYEAYIDTADGRIPWLANGILLENAGPVITNLGVEAIVTSNPYLVDRHLSEGSMKLAAAIGDLYLLQPVQPMPEGVMRFDILIAESDEAAAELIRGDPVRLDSQVILTDTPAVRELDRVVSESDPNASVSIIRRDPEHMVFEVRTAEAGVLVVNDAYYPGWSATVDGEPVDILRANIAFSGVVIEPGLHAVEMHYEPDSIRYGLAVSIMSIVLVGGVFGLSYLERLARLGTNAER
ncbi:MAG: YfhO family protein, partial [Thermomicrobiales bacterium]